MKIELLYDKNCPNINLARENLKQAIDKSNLKLEWKEWELSDKNLPDYAGNFGSPTILINEKDIGKGINTGKDCCRIYPEGENNYTKAPSVDLILESIHLNNESHIQWKKNLTLLPALGTVLMPKLICPACWPAYAGILSSMGIGFIDLTPYLLPLILAFLGITLFFLKYKAERRRGNLPFYLGLVSSLFILTGKFLFDSDNIMYIGLTAIVFASIWNSIPKKRIVASLS